VELRTSRNECELCIATISASHAVSLCCLPLLHQIPFTTSFRILLVWLPPSTIHHFHDLFLLQAVPQEVEPHGEVAIPEPRRPSSAMLAGGYEVEVVVHAALGQDRIVSLPPGIVISRLPVLFRGLKATLPYACV